jgi:hypothetical protein
MGKSSASVRSSLSKASKKEKKEKKDKKESRKKKSSSVSAKSSPTAVTVQPKDRPSAAPLPASSLLESSPPSARHLRVPKHVEFDEESIRQSSSNHDEDDDVGALLLHSPTPPLGLHQPGGGGSKENAMIGISKQAKQDNYASRGGSGGGGAGSSSDLTPTHANQHQHLDEHQGGTMSASVARLPIPDQVSFDGGNGRNMSHHSASSQCDKDGGEGSVVLVPDVSSTTFDYDHDDEEEDDDDDETKAGEALPTLLTHTLWSPSVQVVSSALSDLIDALTEDESALEEDELDPRHEALLLGGHLALIRVIQTYMQYSNVVLDALQALLIMFENVNVYWLGVLGNMGAVEAVVSTLMVKSKDLIVQEQAYRFLVGLLRHKGNASRFLQLDGLAAMFRRLEAFPEDRETNLDVCRVIQALCVWEDTRSVIVSSGAVRTLAGVIDRCNGGAGGNDFTSMTSATTIQTAESPTSSLTPGGDGVDGNASGIYQDPVVQKSARDTMVALVGAEKSPRRHHHRHKSSQHHSSDGGTVSSKKSKSSKKRASSSKSKCEPVPEETMLPVATDDGAAFAAPEPYESYETMMIRDLWSDCDEVVLAALKDISRVLGKGKLTYGKAFIEVGGPLAVTKVVEMRRDPQVQQEGCNILSTLVSLDGFPTILGEVGGVETLLERIRDASTDKLKNAAIKALSKMLKGSPQPNTQRLVAAGGISVLVYVMRENEDSASLQIEACKVLRQVCHSDPAYPVALIRSGVATAIARVLEVHVDDKKTVKAGKKAMKALLD